MVGRRLGAVEYEVSGEVHQVDSVARSGFCKVHGACDIEPDGGVCVGFSLVYGIVCGAVDDPGDSVGANVVLHGCCVSDVELMDVRVQPVGAAFSLCEAAELATELSVSAGNQNVFHLS